jgi:hypothetical protein
MQEQRGRPEHTAELPPLLNRAEAFVCRPAVFSVHGQRHKKSRRTNCARLLTLLLYHLCDTMSLLMSDAQKASRLVSKAGPQSLRALLATAGSEARGNV